MPPRLARSETRARVKSALAQSRDAPRSAARATPIQTRAAVAVLSEPRGRPIADPPKDFGSPPAGPGLRSWEAVAPAEAVTASAGDSASQEAGLADRHEILRVVLDQ